MLGVRSLLAVLLFGFKFPNAVFFDIVVKFNILRLDLFDTIGQLVVLILHARHLNILMQICR